MTFTFNDLSSLSPEEAYQKVAYVQWRIWYEQNVEVPFVKDPRPEFYLRNELRAFWEGRIQEFHGWADPIGQVAQWIIDKLYEVFQWFWEKIVTPAVNAIMDTARWIWDKITGLVSEAVNKIWEILTRLGQLYTFIIQTLYTKLLDAWHWLKDIGSTIYAKVREALSVVWDWLTEKAEYIIEAVKSGVKTFFEFYKQYWAFWFNIIKTLVEKLHDATTSAWHSLTERVSGAFETITKALAALPQAIAAAFQSAISYLVEPLKWIWDHVLVPFGHTLKDALTALWERIKEAMLNIFEHIENLFSSFAPMSPERAPSLGYQLLKVSALATGGLLAMAGIWDLMHPFKDVIPGEVKAMIYDLTNFNKILAAMTGAMFTVAIAQPMKYYYNAKMRPYILSWSDIMELRSRGKLDDETFIRFMHYHGYDDVLKPYFDELANTPLSYFMLRMIAQYGYWDEEFFREEIQRMGYSPKAQQVLFESFRRAVLEPVQGMFGSYVINRYLVGITTLEEVKAEASQLGYTEGQIKQLLLGAQLRNDYEFIKDAVQALTYSLRRGYITIDEYRAQLSALGLRPDKVEEYVRVELLRAPEEGLTTQQEEVRAYGRSTAIKRFKEGLTTMEELEQELRLLGYSEQWIQRLKIIAILERDYDFAMTALSYVKSAWEKGHIGDDMFISLLRQFGFTDEKIMLELQLLKLRKGIGLAGGGA